MKTIITLLIAFFIGIISFAQNGINYKAVIKDGSGTSVANDLIAVQFRIQEGASTVYSESHNPTTDGNGLIILNIGEGTPISGSFATIDWGSDTHFLNVRVNTGDGFVDLGTTEFKSVPYAISSTKAVAMELNDLTNVSENPLNGEVLKYNGSGWEPGTDEGVWSRNANDTYYNVGRVGIGISTPANPFTVLQATGTANTVRFQSLEHPGGKDLLELQIPADSPASSQFIEMQNGSEIVAVINGDGSANFSKVGIDGSPTAKLHIFQEGQVVGSGLRFNDGTINQEWDVTHQFGLTFFYGGSIRATISAVNGAYIQGSDRTLKDQISGLSPVLDKIEKLQPSTYVYKSDERKTSTIGFIAQDVRKIFPEVVQYSEGTGLYGIDYAAFGVIAIKAIQEQQKEIDELKAILKRVESKLNK